MKNLRSIALVFLVVFSLLFLANCKKKFYSLEIPEHITVNVSDLTKIKNKTKVTLTITYPEGKELDFLKVNDDIVEVTDNKYTFKITQNTVVKLTLKNIGDVGVELYKLTLPDGIKANITNLAMIEKGTNIILTITPPKNHELDKLYVNGLRVSVTDNTYTFVLQEDTVVTVEWFALSGWKKYSKTEVYNFFDNFNYSLYSGGTFTAEEHYHHEEEQYTIVSMVELLEDLTPVKFYEYSGENVDNIKDNETYFDGEIIVHGSWGYESHGFQYKTKHIPGAFSIVEVIINDIFAGEPITQVPEINNIMTIDFMNYLAKTGGSQAVLFDKVTIYQNDQTIKVSGIFSSEDLNEIVQDFNALSKEISQSSIEFELLIQDSKIEEFSFKFESIKGEQYNYKLKYEQLNISEPLFFQEFDKALIEDSEMVEVYSDGELLGIFSVMHFFYMFDVNGEIEIYMAEDFGLYKEGFIVEGFYIDSAFNTKVNESNFAGKLYVKWVPIKSLNEIIEKFVPEGKLYLVESSFHNDFYYENDEYILKSSYSSFSFYDKTNDVSYDYSEYDGKLYFANHYNNISIIEKLENSNNYLETNGVYYIFEHLLIVSNSYIIITDKTVSNEIYIPVNDYTAVDNLINDIAALIPEAITPEVKNVGFSHDYYQTIFEINEFASELRMYIEYNSGAIKNYSSIEEGVNEGIVEIDIRIEGNKHRVFLLIGEQEFEMPYYYNFYDETMGIFVYAYDNLDTYLHLIDELPELDNFEPTLLVKRNYYLLMESQDVYYKFYNLEELQAYEGDAKYMHLVLRNEFIDLEELGLLLALEYNLEFEYSNYIYRYDYLRNIFTVKNKNTSYQFNYRIWDDEIYMWDTEEAMIIKHEDEGFDFELMRATFNLGTLNDKLFIQLLEFGRFCRNAYSEKDPIGDPGYYELDNWFFVRFYSDYIYLGDSISGGIDWRFTTNPVEYPDFPNERFD